MEELGHPLAAVVRTLGRGQRGARSLSLELAQQTLGLILDGQARPEQVGAILMLMRLRSETPEEAAGFVQAARQRLAGPLLSSAPCPDVDWGTYAGKRRHLNWYLLAALLLAQNGVRVLMHGAEAEDPDRLYVESLLGRFGHAPATSRADAGLRLQAQNFAYLPLRACLPGLVDLLALRGILGLRSPIHTVARMLNPLDASLSVHGIYHPGYEEIHLRTAELLGGEDVLVFKGDSGEAEVNPEADTTLWQSKLPGSAVMCPLLPGRSARPLALDPDQLQAVWEGRAGDAYGEAAVVATAAAVLWALRRADSLDAAQALARQWWAHRNTPRVCSEALSGKALSALD